MIIFAIILIFTSVFKLIASLVSAYSDNPPITYIDANHKFDPEWIQNFACAAITGDGLIGLICGLYILFA